MHPIPAVPYSLMRLLLLCLACLLAAAAPAAFAQEGNEASMREVIEAEQAAEQLTEEKAGENPRGLAAMSTPLETVLGLRQAIRDRDYELAGRYLDTRYLPEDMAERDPARLVRALTGVWNQQNIIDLSALSDSPEGNLEDGLPPYRDELGQVTTTSGEVPIYLQRVPDDEGRLVWKLSNVTVARIPELWDELGYSPVATFLADHLPDFEFLGMDNWQVIATAIILLLAWPLAALISGLLSRLAQLVPNRFPKGIQRFFRVPFRFFLFVVIAQTLIGHLKLSLAARIVLESSGLDYIAFTVLLLGLMSLVRDYNIRRLEDAGHTQYVALLRPLTTMLKVVVVIIIALVWADQAGYDMTTILAGLGVGSLAVALAAQKTLENLIGAITLYTARPVKPGDFCRFGDIYGNIEEIGLRSTAIRTLDRTLVQIPNSVFSSSEIENYTARDYIRYFCNLRIQLVPRQEMQDLLEQLTAIFDTSQLVLKNTVSLRLTQIEDAAAVLRIEAGLATTDFYDSLQMSEALNLELIERIETSSTRFTGPGQLLQVAQIVESSVQQVPGAAS